MGHANRQLFRVGLVAAILLGLAGPPPAAAADPPVRLDLAGDPLPDGAVARLGTGRFRHHGWRQQILFSPDGKTVITKAEHNSVRFWEAATGRLLGAIDTDDASLADVALSPDGKHLVSVGRIKEEGEEFARTPALRVWEVATRKPVRTVKLPQEGPRGETPGGVAFTPDGKTLILGGTRVWDFGTGVELLDYKHGKGRTQAFALSPDGKLVAAAESSGPVHLWEWETDKPARQLATGERGALSLAFSPDGKRLAAGCDGGEGVLVWDVASGRRLARIDDERTNYVQHLAFGPDGLLATPDRANTLWRDRSGGVHLWDAATGRHVRTLATPGEAGGAVAFHPSGRLACATEACVHVWDTRTWEEVAAGGAEGHRGGVAGMAAVAGLIATASDDHTVRLWDPATGKSLHTLRHKSWVRAVAVSPDGRWVASSSLDDTIVVWDAATGKPFLKLPGHGEMGGRRSLAFTADGKRLLSFGDDFYLRATDLATGKAVIEYKVRPTGVPVPEDDAENREREMFGSVGESAFTADGKTFVLTVGQEFRAFDVTTGKEMRAVQNEGGHVIGLTVSPDGRRLLASSWGKQVQKKLPDGRMLFTTEDNHPACVWDLETGKLIHHLKRPKGGAGLVAFSADGKRFAVAGDRRTPGVTVYDADSGKPVRSFDRLGGAARKLAFSPDGKQLLAAMNDTSILVLDLTLAEG